MHSFIIQKKMVPMKIWKTIIQQRKVLIRNVLIVVDHMKAHMEAKK